MHTAERRTAPAALRFRWPAGDWRESGNEKARTRRALRERDASYSVQCGLRRRAKPRPASARPRSARVVGSGTAALAVNTPTGPLPPTLAPSVSPFWKVSVCRKKVLFIPTTVGKGRVVKSLTFPMNVEGAGPPFHPISGLKPAPMIVRPPENVSTNNGAGATTSSPTNPNAGADRATELTANRPRPPDGSKSGVVLSSRTRNVSWPDGALAAPLNDAEKPPVKSNSISIGAAGIAPATPKKRAKPIKSFFIVDPFGSRPGHMLNSGNVAINVPSM